MTSERELFSAATAQEIQELFGEEKAKYLEKKTTGGNNGYKGTRYEQFFAAHRIARLARKLLETGVDSEVEWQADGFVDDVVVRRTAVADLKAYQLKNAEAVSWTAKNGQIASDFADQYKLSTHEGFKRVRVRLVCNDDAMREALCAAVPETIADYSKALYFPYSEPYLPMLGKFSWMREDFAYISNRENAKRTEAEQVAGVLIGAWCSLAPKAMVSDVLNFARQMSPTIIRSLASDTDAVAQLSQEARDVLDNVEGLTYTVKRGFFAWSDATGTTTGVLPYDCFSTSFQKFQRRILEKKPRSFSELEEML
ncbi:hypothetical protein [Paraburkholderia terricola]|uniref:Uncharacterized protein n=1 Tax=Paraburkholderia terricola TaxID=169427 RepID=A0A1M6LHZ2_9BURK|nr:MULTISPECIES: hypothetical protein [Paraburkholderia]SDN86854.1 hypothetical protein SAMN05192547_1005128 [Paraburkholderia sediminicola]SHJ70803.1 hypothetical protein SAMN05192548_1005129 [Paraburkholderia terricola]